MGWKKCVTGSYDYLNEKGEIIFHIYRPKSYPFFEHSLKSGQVFYGGKYSELVSDENLSVFLLKSLTIAKDKGWDISIKDFNLNPDLSNVEIYESRMYLDNYKEINEINKRRPKDFNLNLDLHTPKE